MMVTIYALEFGKHQMNDRTVVYPKDMKCTLPKEIPVTLNFSCNENMVIGVANNFRRDKKGILCDIHTHLYGIGIAGIPHETEDIDGKKIIKDMDFLSLSLVPAAAERKCKDFCSDKESDGCDHCEADNK